MQKPNNKTVAWAILTLVIVALQLFLGVRYPLPVSPTDGGEAVGEGAVLGTTHFSNLEIGDGAEANQSLTFDGNADDYYMGIQDASDDFMFGLGSTFGTDLRVRVPDDTSRTLITLHDATAADAQVTFDGNADDFYLGLDDSADDLLIGYGSTMGTDARITVVDDDAVTSVQLGDATENDTELIFDGNAQDYYIGLDDSADDLVVGLGAAVGTTAAFAIDENQVTTWSGGQVDLAADATEAFTLTVASCGKTVFLNSATEFQTILPAVSTISAGCSFRFIVKAAPSGASYTVITGNSLENVLIGGVNELEVDTGDDGPYQSAGDTITFVDSVAVVGDTIYMISDGTSYYISGQANADGGITVAQAD